MQKECRLRILDNAPEVDIMGNPMGLRLRFQASPQGALQDNPRGSTPSKNRRECSMRLSKNCGGKELKGHISSYTQAAVIAIEKIQPLSECRQPFKLVLGQDGTRHQDLDMPQISSRQEFSENLQMYVKQEIHFLANKRVLTA